MFAGFSTGSGGRRRGGSNFREPGAGAGNTSGSGRMANLGYMSSGNNGRSQHQAPFLPYQSPASDPFIGADTINRCV